MTATGLDVFDKTLQTTNIWLDEISDASGLDRPVAWRALSVVLHKVRDRLPVDLAAHLGAQLPLLVRGVYYDQYQPEKQPTQCDTPEQFRQEVAEWLSAARPLDPDEAIAAVFAVLERHISEGQLAKVRNALPKGIRMAWDGADARQLASAGA